MTNSKGNSDQNPKDLRNFPKFFELKKNKNQLMMTIERNRLLQKLVQGLLNFGNGVRDNRLRFFVPVPHSGYRTAFAAQESAPTRHRSLLTSFRTLWALPGWGLELSEAGQLSGTCPGAESGLGKRYARILVYTELRCGRPRGSGTEGLGPNREKSWRFPTEGRL